MIVNVAALHHVQYINRLSRILCETIRPDGLFVHFDYIGPQRNQYSFLHWLILRSVNSRLPEKMRKNSFLRPRLSTVLLNDPTEAIHSDIIIETVGSYFDIFERHDTGGGIAFEIMTHNDNMQSCEPDELSPHIEYLLDLDRKFSLLKIIPPFFSYFIAKPRKEVLLAKNEQHNRQMREDQREKKAARLGGVYSLLEYALIKIFPASMELNHPLILLIKKTVRSIFR